MQFSNVKRKVLVRAIVRVVYAVLVMTALPAAAQEEGEEPSDDWEFDAVVPVVVEVKEEPQPDAWKVDATGKFAASQAAYRDWQEGGVNTLSFTTSLLGKAERKSKMWSHKHESRMTFGLVRQEGFEDDVFRKSEDLIRFNMSLQYVGNGLFSLFNPTVAATVRTQFAPGYNYDEVPSDLQQSGYTEDDLPVMVSAFLSPATFTQSLGLTYDPVPSLKQRFGVAGKETVVLINRLRPLYNPEGERVRPQLGFESRTDFDKEIIQNVFVKSSLGLFAAFNNPDTPDLTWENVVTMKVNSWLSADFEYVALYDEDISDAVQMKQVLALGISFVFI